LSFISSCFVVWISFFIAFSSQWYPTRIGKVTTFLSLLPLAIPGLIIGFGMATGFAGTLIDPKNSPTILLIAAYVIRKLPFAVILLSSTVKQVPKVYEEAAVVCGASNFNVFRFILFPLFRSVLGSIFIVVFLSSLFEVSTSLLLPMEEKYFPISKALYALQSRPDGASLTAAYATIVMTIVIAGFYLTSIFQRRSIASLIRGVS
jgi:iron(III) transport system permease protein